jgi:hypothetical protein
VCQAQDFAPSRSVEEMEDGVIVTYTFKGGMHQQDRLYPDAKSWTIPGFGQNMKAGEPSVPVRWDTFSVPSDRVASIELMDCAYTDTAFVLAPAYPPLLMSDTIGYTTDVVLPIQPYQGLFPNSVVQQSRYQSYRGNRMVKVGIYPIQYDAVNQRVRQYSMIQYKLNFTEIPQSELRKTANKKNSARISASDHFLKNVSLNTPQISSAQPEMNTSKSNPIYQSTEDTRTFLIITTPSIASGIYDFEEWKWTMGMNVEIRTSNGWTVNGVKQAVQDVYDNDENLYYLLIIGDIEQVPSMNYYYYESQFDNWSYITDAFYSWLDESGDYTPDILYGRIPVKTAQEAHAVLDKIIQFEKKPTKDEIFYNNATLCAAFFSRMTGGAHETSQSTEYTEQIRSYLMNGIDIEKVAKRIYTTFTPDTVSSGFVYPTYWYGDEQIPIELQKPNFTWEGNTDSIVDAINAKTFLVTGIMHGTPNGWFMPTLSITDTIRLTNKDFYPTIFSMSCCTGKYDENDDCFAEAMLKKHDGGTVAIFAPTHECYTFSSETQLKGYINSIWPMPGINEFISNASPNTNSVPTYEIGAILQQGFEWLGHEYYIILNDTVYFENETNKYLYQGEVFHCFGDPSMQIYTQTPHTFNNPMVNYCNGSIIAQTQENDVRISFFDIDAADWISKSYIGNYAEFEPDEPEDLVYVCFSKPNYSPYIVKCMKNSAIQNGTISDEQHFAAETMKIGTNVVNYIEHGNVLIDGGKVSIHSKTVEIMPNTTIINSEFEVIPTQDFTID